MLANSYIGHTITTVYMGWAIYNIILGFTQPGHLV
jgi:hypothetical protein